MVRYKCPVCYKDRFKVGIFGTKECEGCGWLLTDHGVLLPPEYYVPVIAHDGAGGAPDKNYPGGPLVMESYLATSTKHAVEERIGKYHNGQALIARLVFGGGCVMSNKKAEYNIALDGLKSEIKFLEQQIRAESKRKPRTVLDGKRREILGVLVDTGLFRHNALALMFGVSAATVSNIANRKKGGEG